METQNPEPVKDGAEGEAESPPTESLQPSVESTPGPKSSLAPERLRGEFFGVVFVGQRGIRSGWRLTIWLTATVAAYFVLGAVSALVVQQVPAQTEPLGIVFGDGIAFLGVLAATILMAGIERRTLGDYGLPPHEAFGKQFWQGALWGLIALSALLGAIHLWHGFDLGSLALSGSKLADYAVVWAIAFLVVGLFEETSTRAYALFTLADGIRFWPAAGLLSGIFGAIHLWNGGESWVGALAAALIGLFFCFTVRRTGSLWFAVGMHFAWDYAESFIYSVPDSGAMVTGHLLNSSFHGPVWLTGGTVGPEASVFVFVIIAALFVVFGVIHRDVRFPRPVFQPADAPFAADGSASPLGLDA